MRSRPIRTPVAATALAMAGVLSFFAACSSDPTSTGPDDNPVPENQIPVADAGSDVTVSATVAVTLDGSASSDGDGDVLTYEWSLVTTPSGSQAALDDATLAAPSFTPDLPGVYVARLVVNDGTDGSQPDDVTVTAEDNTAAVMIEAATGGEVTSLNGSVTLSIPAGALDSDTEIKVTAVPKEQYEHRFGDLGEGAVVYDLQPDGLRFQEPARMALEVSLATSSPESVQVNLPLLISVSGDSAEILGNQSLEVLAGASTATARADLEHFSEFISVQGTGKNDEVLRGAGISAHVDGIPYESPVGVVFDVTLFLSEEEDSEDGDVIAIEDATVVDHSIKPVAVVAPFDPTLFAEVKNRYTCTEDGVGKYISFITMEVLYEPSGSEEWDELEVISETITAHPVDVTIAFDLDVGCADDTDLPPPFEEFEMPLPEILARLDASGTDLTALFAVPFPAGAIVATGAGEPTAKLLGIPPSVAAVYAAAGTAAKGVLLATSAGLYEVTGPIPVLHDTPVPEMPFVRAEATVVGITDNTGNTTDVLAFGNDPSTNKYAVVQRGDKNIMFGELADGFKADDATITVWRDDDQSVFSDPPQSAYVGPNGLTVDNSMLVVTVAEDGTGASTLYYVQLLSDGTVQLTPVNSVPLLEHARMVRCLDDLCAISSYGSELGFGGMTYFRWDGGTNITPIGNRLGSRPVGFDMVVDASGNTLVASTDFFGTEYFIDEIDPNGQLVSSNSYPLPGGCTGAVSTLFRTLSEVIISCNISGLVTSDDAFAQ